MVVMKRIKYSIISLVVFSACSQNTNKKEEVKNPETSINETKKTDDSIIRTHESNNTISDQLSDTVKKTNSNNPLLVEIDGQIFYKKNASDFRVDNSYYYRTKDNKSEYNIKTGKFNHDYQLPHGGKVIADTFK